MQFKAILVLAICFSCIMSYKLFKGDAIPKDYAVGKIKYLEYIRNDKLFFTTEQDVFGLMDAKMGALTLVYELQDNQKILQHRGSRFLVVQKDKDINLLFPRNETYFKLQYSKFLQKQTFKQILSFKRFFKHDYILTDQFLAKALNPYAGSTFNQNQTQTQTQVDKFEIILKRTDLNDRYLKLINLSERYPTIGLVSLKQSNNSQSLCIIKFLMMNEQKLQTVCTSIDSKLTVLNVMQMGPNIQVQTDKNDIFYNTKLQVIEEIKNKDMFTFFNQMNKAIDPNYRKDSNQLKSNTRIAMNFANPVNHKSVDVYQRYILVKKDSVVLVNIAKSPQDRPINYWIYNTELNSINFDLIVQYQDGKVFCYQIDQKAKSYKQLWTFHINPADKTALGQQRQVKEVNLQTKQDLLEQVDNNKENDIQINNGSTDKP